MKCPSCGSVGELEAFVRAAAGVADSGSGAAAAPPDPPAAETMPRIPVPSMAERPPEPETAADAASPPEAAEVEEPAAAPASPGPKEAGTQISGSATALNLPPGLRCTLTVLSGPDSGKKLALTRPRVVVGREQGDFPLTDQEVSKEHCAFEVSGVTCTVRDLGSRNGTYVDGEKVSSRQLSNVGEVSIGNTTLLFTMTLEDTVQGG